MLKIFIIVLFSTIILIGFYNIIITYNYQFIDIKTFEKINSTTTATLTNNIAEKIEIKSIKLFCIILTSKKQYKIRPKIVYESWAHKCDDFRFVTKLPNDNLNELAKQNNLSKLQIEFKNESIEFKLDENIKFLHPAHLTHDSYKQLTTKVYLTLKDIYKRYNQYDWYLKTDDDTFIFVDNLRKFLINKNSSMPITYGYDFKLFVKNGYHSGGAGYVLSKESLQRIGSKLNKNFKFCPNSGNYT